MMPGSNTVTVSAREVEPSSGAGSASRTRFGTGDPGEDWNLRASWEGEVPLSGRVCGYAHPDYAGSFCEVGTPMRLPECGGWLIKRPVPGGNGWDAMGSYPLFCCQDWRRLGADLNALHEHLVSVAAVLDPFGDYDQELLRDCFPDRLVAFKKHFVVDLAADWRRHLPENHQRNARKALRSLHVEACNTPERHLDEWRGLYADLIRRHQITGIRTFSRRSFAHQFQVPEMRMFRARLGSQAVGMLLWYVQGEIAYYHLGACSPKGYELGASFALFWTALEYFSSGTGARWLELGAGSGTQDSRDDGLSRFKRGWATGTRTAYFGGRILDRTAYRSLVKNGGNGNPYFPAYRAGEFS